MVGLWGYEIESYSCKESIRVKIDHKNITVSELHIFLMLTSSKQSSLFFMGVVRGEVS